MTTHDFTALPDLASRALGASVSAAMGTEIDNVIEFEELALAGDDAPTAIALLD